MSVFWIVYLTGYVIAGYLWARAAFTRDNWKPGEIRPGKLSSALGAGVAYGWLWPFWLVLIPGMLLHDCYKGDLGYRIGVKLFGKPR